jgi:hypothetical protein
MKFSKYMMHDEMSEMSQILSSKTSKLDTPINNENEDYFNAINYVAVHGYPNNGKSTLCNQITKRRSDILWVQTDYIFLDLINRFIPNKDQYFLLEPSPHFSISKFIHSNDYDQQLFVYHLKDNISKLLKTDKSINFALLDGYVFKEHEAIFDELKIPHNRRMSIECQVHNGAYKACNIDVTDYRYSHVESKIQDYFGLP